MPTLAFLVVIALTQADSASSQPIQHPYLGEDPFALDDAPPPAAAPPAPAAESAAAEPSPETLICRSRPALGSRTRYFRVCMTRLQWEHHETNMEQQRRDINDMGAQGCDRNHGSGCITAAARPGA